MEKKLWIGGGYSYSILRLKCSYHGNPDARNSLPELNAHPRAGSEDVRGSSCEKGGEEYYARAIGSTTKLLP